jgi:chromosome segregation ATPase
MSSNGLDKSSSSHKSDASFSDIPMSSWKVPKAWLDPFFRELTKYDLKRIEKQRRSLESIENHFANLLDRHCEYQARSKEFHRLREEMLESDVELLRKTVDKYREQASDQSDLQIESDRQKRELDSSIQALKGQLAALRLEQAAQPSEQGPEDGEVGPSLGRRFGIPQESEDSSIANPVLLPVDMGNVEVLAFQVSVLQNENARLKQDVQTMTEILEGSGVMDHRKADEKRTEWEVRAKAAEETARAATLLIEELWHNGSPLVASQMAENADFVNRIRVSPIKNIEELVALFESEQDAWFENDKLYESQLNEWQRKSQDLQNELEEAYRQNELQRAKTSAGHGEKNKLEQEKLQLRVELDKLKDESGLKDRKQAEMGAELQEIKESLVGLGKEAADAVSTRQDALSRLGGNLGRSLWSLKDKSFGQDFRDDFEVIRQTWAAQRAEHEHEVQQIFEPASRAFEGDEADVDALIFAQRSFHNRCDRLHHRSEEAEAYKEELTAARCDHDEIVESSYAAINERLRETQECNVRLLDFDKTIADISQEYAAAQSAVHRVQQAYQQNQAAKELLEMAQQRLERSLKTVRGRLAVVGGERRELSETLETQLRNQANVQHELADERHKNPRDAARITDLESQSQASAALMEQLREALEASKETENTDHEALADFEKQLESARAQVSEVEQLQWDSESALREAETNAQTILNHLDRVDRERDELADEVVRLRDKTVELYENVTLHEFEKSQCQKTINWINQRSADSSDEAKKLSQICRELSALIEQSVEEDSSLLGLADDYIRLSEDLAPLVKEDDEREDLVARLDQNARITALDCSSKLRDSLLHQELEVNESLEVTCQQALAISVQIQEQRQQLEGARQELDDQQNPIDKECLEETQRLRPSLVEELEALEIKRSNIEQNWKKKEQELAQLRAELTFHDRICQNISAPEDLQDKSLQSFIVELQHQRSALSVLAASSQHPHSSSQEMTAMLTALRVSLDSEEFDDVYEVLDQLESSFSQADQNRQSILAQLEQNAKRLDQEKLQLSTVKDLVKDPHRQQQTFLETTLYMLDKVTQQDARSAERSQLIEELEHSGREIKSEVDALHSSLTSSRAECQLLRQQLTDKGEAVGAYVLIEEQQAGESQLNLLQSQLDHEQKANRSLTRRLTLAQIETEKHLKEIEQLRELEDKYDHSTKAQQEAQKFIEKHQQQIADIKRGQKQESADSSGEMGKLVKKKERELKKLRIFLESERKKNEHLVEERKRLKKHIAEGKHSRGARIERDKKRALRRHVPLASKASPPRKVDPLKAKVQEVLDEADVDKNKGYFIASLKETVRRAQNQATKMAQVYKKERQKHVASLKRLEMMKNNQVHEGRLTELQKQMHRLQQRLKQESSARAQVERSSQSKLEELYRKLKVSERQLEAHNEKVSKLEAEINLREKSALNSKAETLRLGRELEDARLTLLGKERDLKDANQELKHREQRVDKLQTELQRAQSRVIEAEGDSLTVHELGNRLDRARIGALEAERLLDQKSQLLVDEQEHRDQLEKARRTAEEEVEKLNQRLSKSSVMNFQELEKSRRLESQLQTVQKSLYEQEQALDNARVSLGDKNNSVSTLEAHLAEAQLELERNRVTARIELRSIEDELETALVEVEQRSETIDQLTKKVESDQVIRRNLEEQSASAEQLATRLSDIQDNYKSSEQDVIAKTQQLNNSEQRLKDALSRIEELSIQVGDSTKTLSELRSELEETQSSHEQLRQRKDELEKLHEESERSEGLEKELVDHAQQVHSVDEQLDGLEQKYNATHSFAQHLQEKLTEAQGVARESRDIIAQTADELQDQQTSADALKEELNSTRTTLLKVSEERNHLAAQFIDHQLPEHVAIDELQKELESERQKCLGIEEQTKEIGAAYHDELGKLRGELALSQEALQTREQELESTRARLKNTQERARELGAQVDEGRHALSKAEVAFEQAYKEFAVTQTPASGAPLDAKLLEKQKDTDQEFKKVKQNLDALRFELEDKDYVLRVAKDEAVVQKELVGSLERALQDARDFAEGEAQSALEEREANRAWLSELMESLDDTRAEFEKVQGELEFREHEMLQQREEMDQLTHDRTQALQLREQEALSKQEAKAELKSARQNCLHLEERLSEQRALLEQRGAEIASTHANSQKFTEMEVVREQEFISAQNTIQDITNEVKALRAALTDSESELGELRDQLNNGFEDDAGAASLKLDSAALCPSDEYENEIVHWLVYEDYAQLTYPAPIKVSKDLMESLQKNHERSLLEVEVYHSGANEDDTRKIWESMKLESKLEMTSDFIGWLEVELPDSLRQSLASDRNKGQQSEANLLVDEEARLLETELRRLESTYEWARSEGMASAELERKLESTRLRLKSMTGTQSIPLKVSHVEEEYLQFYEGLLKSKNDNIKGLQDEKKKSERDAMFTINLMENENQNLVEELKNTYERLTDLDQVIISLQAAKPGQEIETLVHEQAELRQCLRRKSEELIELDDVIRGTGEETRIRLRESRQTVDRLERMLERSQDENEALKEALREDTDQGL